MPWSPLNLCLTPGCEDFGVCLNISCSEILTFELTVTGIVEHLMRLKSRGSQDELGHFIQRGTETVHIVRGAPHH